MHYLNTSAKRRGVPGRTAALRHPHPNFAHPFTCCCCCSRTSLQPTARIAVLRQLWPLVSRITDVSRRVAIFTTTWHALVAAEMEVRTAGVAPPPTLSTNNPFPAASGVAATGADDPLGLLAALSVPPTGPSGVAASAGVLTAVPSTTSIVALLGDPYLEVLMTGKAPVGDPAGAFAAAQGAFFSAHALPPTVARLPSVQLLDDRTDSCSVPLASGTQCRSASWTRYGTFCLAS